MASIKDARDKFNAGDYEGSFLGCEGIRDSAVPLLKNTWDLVKRGEPGYRRIRAIAQWTIAGGVVLLVVLALYFAWQAYS
jgi:hypothetical protein